MRGRRAERASRIAVLLADVDHAVAALRHELQSEADIQARAMPKGGSR